MLLQELINKKKEYEETLKRDSQAAFKEYMKEFFDKNPNVEAVAWVQYTPYWNDGEPCYFGIGEVTFKLKNEQYEDDEDGYWDEYEKYTSIYSMSGPEKKPCKQLADDFETIEDVLEITFGDHVSVEVTRDEITVDEYSHD